MTFDSKTALALAEQLEQADTGSTAAPWQYGQLEFGGRMLRDGNGYVFAQVDDDGNGRACATLRNLAADCARALREACDVVANPSTDGCATCETDHRRVLIDKLRAECEAMRVENAELRRYVDTDGDYHEAWSVRGTAIALADERDALAAEVERLKAEVKGLRSLTAHHAPRATGFCDSCSRYSCTLRLVDDQMRCGSCTNIATAAAGKESGE